MLLYDVNIMCSKVLGLEKAYLFATNHFEIHCVSLLKN